MVRKRNSRCVSTSPSNLSGSRGRLGLSPNTLGSLVIPAGPEPGTIDCSASISPSWKASGSLAGGFVRESTGEGQLIQRVDPVRAQIVELPIGVGITLLHGVIGSHAHVNRDDVGLSVGEV